MDKRRNKKFNNNWKNQKNNEQPNKNNTASQKTFLFNPTNYEDENSNRERQKAILEMKAREIVCPVCGELITEIASCLTDKKSGKPAHFDCVLNEVSKSETLGENEKIAYIGQGRFGILYYENPRDQRHFTIKKIIEVEDRDNKPEWRDEISSLYSKVN